VPGCCRAATCQEFFNAREARRNLSRYRRKGLGGIERQMVASLDAGLLRDARVLEIGGGIGMIQAELLKAGAARGEIVELVQAYEPFARELAHDQHIEGRTTFKVADVLDQPDTVSPADVVVMNRVVCCSPDGVRLAGVAAGLAGRALIMSFPRDRLFVRIGGRVLNAVLGALGRSFRVFLHPRDALQAAAQAQGLRPAGSGRSFAWEFVAFRRHA
jgi:hypothetical protein